VGSDSLHFSLVVADQSVVNLDPPDVVSSQALSGVSMEEISVGIVFPDGSLLAPLFPVGRALTDRHSQAVMRERAQLQLCRRQGTGFFKQIEK
jgi:hypothetical protein